MGVVGRVKGWFSGKKSRVDSASNGGTTGVDHAESERGKKDKAACAERTPDKVKRRKRGGGVYENNVPMPPNEKRIVVKSSAYDKNAPKSSDPAQIEEKKRKEALTQPQENAVSERETKLLKEEDDERTAQGEKDTAALSPYEQQVMKESGDKFWAGKKKEETEEAAREAALAPAERQAELQANKEDTAKREGRKQSSKDRTAAKKAQDKEDYENLSPIEQKKVDKEKLTAKLNKHVKTQQKLQNIIHGKDKAGQGDIIGSLSSAANDLEDKEKTPEEQSALIMKIATFARYENVSNKSVLAKYNEEDPTSLSDVDKWSLIVGNSEFMKYIASGMTINKIIPDSALKDMAGLTVLRGSTARAQNYEGISGADAISNFGLDYSGYQTEDKSDTISKTSKWSGLPEYVAAKNNGDHSDLDTLKNVFYLQMTLPAKNMSMVKVPIHKNLRTFARRRLAEVLETLDMYGRDASLRKGALPMVNALEEKREMLERFLKFSLFSSSMEVSAKEDGETKNPDDPLTNLGMTKPSARLKGTFQTINQEYHVGPIVLPEGSGLWLKDDSKKDTQVAKLTKISKGGKDSLSWEFIDSAIAKKEAALQENIDFHTRYNTAFKPK